MKEMLFSSSDAERMLLGKLARKMMSFLSIPVDEDVQQTLSFFEKVEHNFSLFHPMKLFTYRHALMF